MYYSRSREAFLSSAHIKDYKRTGSWPDDAIEVTNSEWQIYGLGHPPEGMQRGADEHGRPIWIALLPESLASIAGRKRSAIETSRKIAEREGVTVNGIRYAGDPGNRQAIMEVLDLFTSTGQDSIASWKDSDDRFHADHPVADVREALMAIATRRGELISREGELNAQIEAALDAQDRETLEAIAWSEE